MVNNFAVIKVREVREGSVVPIKIPVSENISDQKREVREQQVMISAPPKVVNLVRVVTL